jgi:hypothetical protein
MARQGGAIEARIVVKDWEGVRALVQRQRRCRRPQDRWLLTRLGPTYDEQRDTEPLDWCHGISVISLMSSPHLRCRVSIEEEEISEPDQGRE